MVKGLERFQYLEAKEFKLSNTVWNDMIMDLFGRRLSSTSGKVAYDYDENVIKFDSGGSITNSADRVGGNQEINHEYKSGNIILKPHIHWFQDAATKFVITMRYRVQINGQAKTTEWTTTTLVANDGDDIWEYPGSGTLNQITSFPNISVNVGVSDTIQIQMTRTDNLGGDMSIYFFDLHGEIDSLGSAKEYQKFV